MATYLTGLDLIDEITRTGVDRVNRSQTDPAFESMHQTVITRVEALLLAQGYSLVASRPLDAVTHSLVFGAPGYNTPAYVELRYVHRFSNPLHYALCFVNDRHLSQFMRPYQSFVVDLQGDDADIMERQFLELSNGDPEIKQYFWVPILMGTKLAHY